MGIRLSTKKIAQLQAASAMLLSPFSYESGDEWRDAVGAAIAPIVDARASIFGLSLADEHLLVGESEAVTAMAPYMPPTGWLREGYVRSLRICRGNVMDWREAYDPGSIKKTDFYSEVVCPNKLFAPLMLTADVPGTPLGAAVFNYFENESKADAQAEERKQILQLLVPSFQAGVNAYVAMRRQRDTLISFGEVSHVALALFNLPGRTLHQSAAFRQLISRDPEGPRLRAEVARLAANLTASLSGKNPLAQVDHAIRSRLTTRSGSYGLSAMSFADLFGNALTIGVVIEDLSPPRFDAQRLASEYHLTRRELQTAALLQRRMPAKEIATALGVSVNTARRHTEHLFAKLGVHSRRAAWERLSGVS